MLTKTRHNKKRNTAFLYETLVRELTKSIVSKDHKRKNVVVSIIKEHFNKSSALKKELDLYRDLYESESMHPYVCEKLIHEIKKSHSNLDTKQIFDEQTALIKKINNLLSKNVFSNFVPNYKNLATIAQILNPGVSAKSRVILEGNLVRRLSESVGETEEKMSPIDNIVYSTFVKKFNEQYGEGLLEGQKELLSRYIASFHDNAIELSIFLNEEIHRLNECLLIASSNAKENNNSQLLERITKVLSVLKKSSKSDITIEQISQILKIQSLVKELETNGD